MTYTVRILPRAKADRRELFDYLVQRSPQGAAAWEEAYEACLDRLESEPHQGGLAPETVHFDFDLRQAFFQTKSGKPYRVVFRIDSEEVFILAIRGHGRSSVSSKDID